MQGESPRSSTDNRYAVSPAIATQADPPSSGSLPYAGFWRRLGAYVIDYILVGTVLQVVSRGFVSPNGARGLTLLWLSIAGCLYYVLLESSSMQATLGKKAVGIKVTDLHGERISFARALGRLFGHIVSFLILGIGFAMAVFTERRQTLHDKMAGTLVVNREESAEDIGSAGIAPPAPMWQSVSAVLGLMLFGPFGLGILAAIAIPAYQNYTLRAQITEGLNIGDSYKSAVATAVANGTPLSRIDSSRIDVSLPDSAKYVESVRVIQGAIDIKYGRSANQKIKGGHLILVPGLRGSDLVWVCGHASAPQDVSVSVPDFQKYTNVPDSVLPSLCRTGAGALGQNH